MCCVCVAASWTRVSRCRSRERTAHTVSGGRKEARRRPTECRDLEPLAVLDVRFPPRDVLHVPGVHQVHFELPRLQDLVEGDPGAPGGLHGDGGHAALREPIGQAEPVLREGPEAPDGLRVPVEGHTDVELGGADVDPRGVRVQDRRGDDAGGAARASSGHGVSSSGWVRATAGRRPRACGNGWYSFNRARHRPVAFTAGAAPVTCARALAPRC